MLTVVAASVEGSMQASSANGDRRGSPWPRLHPHHQPTPVATWHEVIGEPTLGDAILDRIVHNAYRLELDGPSMRKIKAVEAIEPPAQPTTAADGKAWKGAKK
jgi:hypothetical protein